MLCLTLTGKTVDENLKTLSLNRDFVSCAELRLDCLESAEYQKAASFPENAGIPVILTNRRESDGGKWTAGEKRRIGTLKSVLNPSFSYVDIEADVKNPQLEAFCAESGIEIIRSFHDFNGVPADLYARISKTAQRGGIPKFAVTPHTVSDLIMLFNCERELRSIEKKIIVGMGRFGIPARILYRLTGSFLMYCGQGEEAPGMLSASVMHKLYHAPRINADTLIYGIVGNPVMHSISPYIHNPGFDGINFNAVYVPFEAESVRSFLKLSELLNIRGFSVTTPFKKEILPYIGRLSREVKTIGACNTVVRRENCLTGSNTDYYGFLELLSPFFDEKKTQKAIILGNGSVAGTVCRALRSRGVKVLILGRDAKKAELLAKETMSLSDTLNNASKYSGRADFIIQATTLGTDLNPGNPAPDYVFSGNEVVLELNYHPCETEFLARAQSAGCRTFNGLDFLKAQGMLQFTAFSGYRFPENVKLGF